MEIKLFGKSSCPLCKKALEKYSFFIDRWNLKEQVKISYYDMETLDGLTEGAYYEVIDVPTTIFEKDGQQIAKFEKKVPTSEEFKPLIN